MRHHLHHRAGEPQGRASEAPGGGDDLKADEAAERDEAMCAIDE